MLDIIKGDWHWAVSGALAGITMLLLTYFGKFFGLTSTYGTICSIALNKKWYSLFDYQWRDQIWNLVFAFGIILGAFISTQFLSDNNTLTFSEKSSESLLSKGLIDEIPANREFNTMPESIFNINKFTNYKIILYLFIGGIVSGFGSRYAGGCTSGHFISGLSNLQIPSFITLCFFFVGGLITTHFLLPFLIQIV